MEDKPPAEPITKRDIAELIQGITTIQKKIDSVETTLRGDITRLAISGVKTEETIRLVKDDITRLAISAVKTEETVLRVKDELTISLKNEIVFSF